jgi:hypothetical protein
VFIGMDDGVYYRDDRLAEWVRFDGEPGARLSTIVTHLVIDEPRQRLFVATFGRGIWVSNLPSVCSENCGQPRQLRSPPRTPQTKSEPGAYLGPSDVFERQ